MSKFCIFLCIFLTFTMELTMSDEMDCKTVSGVDPNKPCIFPFKLHEGTIHEITLNACTTAWNENPRDPAWCPTMVNESGGYVFGNWGICEAKCQPRKLISF